MKPQVHYGYMRDGKLHCQSIRLALAELDGENVELTVRKSGEARRSNPQNDYIHWMFQFIAKALKDRTGNEFNRHEVKEWLKMEFLTYEKISPDGEVITMMKGTSELNKEDMTAFIDNCIRRLAGMGIVVPLPGEQMKIAA